MAHQDRYNKTACNAVIISQPNSIFLKRLLDAYQSFNQNCWACHSVQVPRQLSLIYQSEVTILPSETFFRPYWSETKQLYVYNNYNFTKNYACHLWSKLTDKKYLQSLTPHTALTLNSTFGRMLRYAIGTDTLNQLNQTSTT
ncbi:unnamed protein product [Didymodactylos carnosus]|uniref:Uncharacterized protein n=1 Tax=Didymodactylos carnosus TaxID=1234261 RepID=A0A815J5D2_9BILA|nr:unnamed protein product [Didymodactylos carnosus]CAF1375897.1 unnamed protein product [Didymodactylos carnosus]CAF4074199.1 unnamed protein product [Didymodactylos carnosus]CAF4266283.1 unnamed protein product [Didymodactylos carnosus]